MALKVSFVWSVSNAHHKPPKGRRWPSAACVHLFLYGDRLLNIMCCIFFFILCILPWPPLCPSTSNPFPFYSMSSFSFHSFFLNSHFISFYLIVSAQSYSRTDRIPCQWKRMPSKVFKYIFLLNLRFKSILEDFGIILSDLYSKNRNSPLG